jgi:2-octaprenyl-6-methoxyphenol hydroxylase
MPGNEFAMLEFSTDVAVVGAGPAGLASALAVATAGAATAVIGAPASDSRTTALLASSVTALEALGVWDYCRDHAAPLRVMRIVDATSRLLRSPEVRFECSEVGLEEFGFNIENRHLVEALMRRARELPAIAFHDSAASGVTLDRVGARITLNAGDDVTTRLVIGADGRHSLCRAAAGIATERHAYPQVALTFNLAHSRPHHDISTEFHTERGPFTLVPLPGRRSSLVWVTSPRDADRIAALDDGVLAAEIERVAHSILGKVMLEDGRGRFPLTAETAQSFSAERLVLVGEAAHVMPPIGAQGFNLGLRDAATIAELVAHGIRRGGDIGGAEVTQTYERRRRADTTTRIMAVDLLNRSLLSEFLPVQAMRGLGLYLLDRIGPLRRAVMREGVAPAAAMPRLMRGELL